MGKTAISSTDSIMLTLKRVRDDLDIATLDNTPLTPNPRHSKRQVEYSSDEEKKLVRMLRNKPWISYHDCESSSSEDDFEYEKISRSSSLPIGVIRGCVSCEGCQKVLARWKPEAGCRPTLEDAPVYFPLESEFEDTLKYIASISAEAQQYGICRIVPPQSWRPPCPLKDDESRETTKFYTRVQKLDKLQVRQSGGKKEKKKKRRGRRMQRDGRTGRRSLYFSESCKSSHMDSSDEEDKFGFEPGPTFTLEGFKKYADQFKQEYFGLKDQNDVSSKNELSVESIEGEYWRIVQHATEQLEVLYGADIETGIFGSGFPKSKPGVEPGFYESSGWNLNNIARLPGSALAFEEGHISGVLEPWLYVGMCFSSFCWHVEDHHLYSLNYLHFGSPKVWYGVPGNAASKLEETMKKHLPSLFEEQPDLLHKLVTQLSPAILKEAGVPIYRVVQRPGEFVVTFPRAYHSGFNSGFNCAEAVNVAPMDWLPHGQTAIELYKKQNRKTSVSHDKLLLGAVKKHLGISSQHMCEAEVDAAWQGSFSQHRVLIKVLKDRVDVERKRRAGVANSVHVKKMQSDFDAVHERECSVCQYDLHLSAIGCECVNEVYTCLEHVRDLCKCDSTKKYALYRHTLSELDGLVVALEEKARAVNTYEKILANISKLEASMEACPRLTISSKLGNSKPISNPKEIEPTDLSGESTITAKAASSSVEATESHNNAIPFEVSSVSLTFDEMKKAAPATGTAMEVCLHSSISCSHETSNVTSCPTEVTELGSNSSATAGISSSSTEPTEFCHQIPIPCEVSSVSTAVDEQEQPFPISGGTIWSMGLDELKAFFQIGVESQAQASEKHDENCGILSSLSIQSGSTSGLSMASALSMPNNNHPWSGNVSEEAKRVEMIVLSDDEEFPDGHSLFTNSYLKLVVGEDSNAIDLKSGCVLPVETENQSTGISWNSNAPMGIQLDGTGKMSKSKLINSTEQADFTVKLKHSSLQGDFKNFQTDFGANASIHTDLNNEWLQHRTPQNSDQGNSQQGNARHLLTHGISKVGNTRHVLTQKKSQMGNTLVTQQNSQVTDTLLTPQNSEGGKTIFNQQNLHMGNKGHILTQQKSQVADTGHLLTQRNSQVGNALLSKRNSQMGNAGSFLTQQNSQGDGTLLSQHNSQVSDTVHLLTPQNSQVGNTLLTQQNSQMGNAGDLLTQKKSEVGDIRHMITQKDSEVGKIIQQNLQVGSTEHLLARQNSHVGNTLLNWQNSQMSNTGHLLTQGNPQVSNTGNLLTRHNSQVGNAGHLFIQKNSQVNNTGQLLTQKNSQVSNTGQLLTQETLQLINTGHLLTQTSLHATDASHLLTQQNSQVGNTGQFSTKKNPQLGITLTQQNSLVGDTGHSLTQTSSHAGDASHLLTQQNSQVGNTGQSLFKKKSQLGITLTQRTSQMDDTGHLLTQTSSRACDTSHLLTQTSSRACDTSHLLTQTSSRAGDPSYLLTPTCSRAGDTSHLLTQQNSQVGNAGQFLTKQSPQLGITLTQKTSQVGDTGHALTQTSSHAGDTSHILTHQNSQAGNAGQFLNKKKSQLGITSTQQTSQVGDTGHLLSKTSSHAGETSHLLTQSNSQLGNTGQFLTKQRSQLGITLTQQTSQVDDTGHLLTQSSSHVGDTSHLLTQTSSLVGDTSHLLTQAEHDMGLAAVISPSAVRDNAQQTNCLLGQPQGAYSVELLNVGRIMVGKAWCNKDAIFPAGFQSRVLFPSVLDPSQQCFYLSEVIDWGQAGPLFKVTMNDYPSEVFVHPNIDKCWQLVQKRVNMATQLHQCLGKVGLPPLREPDEVSGYELYGFTSPHIITAVELLDWRHQCVEYWAGRVSDIDFPENQFWMAKPNNSGMSFYQPYDIRLPSRIGF